MARHLALILYKITVMKSIVVAVLITLSSQAYALCTAPLCSCSVSATGVPFGTYNPMTGLSQDITGTVSFSCNATAGLLIPFSAALSTGASQSFSSRYMLSGTNRLYYNLYSDAARTIVWGNGTAGSSTVDGNIILSLLGTVTLTGTVFGRILANQTTAVPGTYTDSIVLTVTYY